MTGTVDHAAHWAALKGIAGSLLRLLDELYSDNNGRSSEYETQAERLERLLEMLGPTQTDPSLAEAISSLKAALKRRYGPAARVEVASLEVMISIAALEIYLSRKLSVDFALQDPVKAKLKPQHGESEIASKVGLGLSRPLIRRKRFDAVNVAGKRRK